MTKSNSISKTLATAPPTNLGGPLQRRQEELLRIGAEEAEQSLNELMSGVAFNNRSHRVSLFYGVEAEENLETFIYKANPSIVIDPENLPPGVEWKSVNPSTSIATLIKRFGDRLVFAAGEHRERTVTVLLWDVISKEERTLRVLVRAAN